MGAPAEIIEDIFTVIEGGSVIGEAAEIIQFPSDNGANTFTAVNKTFRSTNGTGLNYWVAAVVQGTSAISAGALFLTVTVPEFIAFAVPCLGIGVGTAFYNIDPEGWTNLALLLTNAGLTVKNKVVAFMIDKGIIAFPPGSIEILKEELCRLGAFDDRESWDGNQPETFELVEPLITTTKMFTAELSHVETDFYYAGSYKWSNYYAVMGLLVPGSYQDYKVTSATDDENIYILITSKHSFNTGLYGFRNSDLSHVMSSSSPMQEYTYDDRTVYYYLYTYSPNEVIDTIGTNVENFNPPDVSANELAWITQYGEFTDDDNKDNYQEGAQLPQKGVPFRTTYPDWLPWEFPELVPWQIPEVMPIQYPKILPTEVEPYQDPAQNPTGDEEGVGDEAVGTLEDPNSDPDEDEEEENQNRDEDEDEEEDDDEDDVLDEGDDTVDDPIDPDPGEIITPVIPITPFPDSVSSNKLFTVYNPSSSQLDSLGGYLWDTDLIDQLKRIWQEPLDGIISLSQIYCTPVTGSPHNIILGFLDSGISANIVTSQFTTIDCGSVNIPEIKENATDYSPYTSIQLYLPFIGITEIDVDEFMGGSIGVKYKVDVYTGTCLAQVTMTRTKDVPHGGIVYTFNGNCSQQIPLTSGDTRGLIATLMSAAGVGIGVATGGALGIAEATAGMSHVIRREMLHVNHSGNLSANAGILGQKKPYIIISRQNPYNANSYNRMYGYPCNKTVYLGNCDGYVRVKAGRLKGYATQVEKDEIMEFLMDGVIM